ncbi:MAG: hypothetical protein AB8F74_17045 [Saprospiraceae bacterium]
MDNLEKFITNNRAAFDSKQPPGHIWENLDRDLPKQNVKRIRLWRGFRVAASVALLIAVGALLGSYLTSKNFAAENIASKLPQDFTEMEAYYQDEVDTKLQRLTSVNVDKDQVVMDLEQLDAALKELKEDILSAPKGSEEQIINAMILNYKTKIDLLETILTHVESDSKTIQNDKENEGINL